MDEEGDDGDLDDLMTVKRRDHDLSDEEGGVDEDEEELPVVEAERGMGKRAVTKAAAAKKMMKKNIKVR